MLPLLLCPLLLLLLLLLLLDPGLPPATPLQVLLLSLPNQRRPMLSPLLLPLLLLLLILIQPILLPLLPPPLQGSSRTPSLPASSSIDINCSCWCTGNGVCRFARHSLPGLLSPPTCLLAGLLLSLLLLLLLLMTISGLSSTALSAARALSAWVSRATSLSHN
jgi:hypothetical protein